MGLQNPFRAAVLTYLILGTFSTVLAQQKPQWMPGQIGLNAGVQASLGFTYANITINYDAGTFNGPKGNAVPVIGNYNVWAVENVFIFVPETKFLGGHLGFQALLTPASGSLVADLNIEGVPNLGAAGGGGGGL